MSLNITQGEDLIVSVTVYDKQNQLVDLDSADKIRVGFIIKGNLEQKYLDSTRETALPGYGEVNVDPIDISKLNITVTREQSKDFPVGDLKARILAEYPDTLLDGQAFEYEVLIGNVLQGYLKNEDLSL